MKKRRKGRIREFERESHGKSVEAYRQERRDAQTAVQARPRKRRFRWNKGRLLLTAIVIALIVVVGMSVKTVFDLRAEQRTLETDHKALTAEQKALQEELKNVNELDYIEEQARIQLKLIKPGEMLYILQEDGKLPAQTDTTQTDGDEADED